MPLKTAKLHVYAFDHIFIVKNPTIDVDTCGSVVLNSVKVHVEPFKYGFNVWYYFTSLVLWDKGKGLDFIHRLGWAVRIDE